VALDRLLELRRDYEVSLHGVALALAAPSSKIVSSVSCGKSE
jgi:hypothetical protein